MENKEKNLGSVKNIKCILIKPIKLTIDSMDMRSLTLLVGPNGSGKTMINKIVYFATLSTFLNITEKNSVLPINLNTFAERVQYIFDNTFTQTIELTGSMVVNFEHGVFSCTITNGIISDLVISYDEGVNSGTYPKYMSTATRLFSSMESILFMDKSLPNSDVLKRCKLYDLLHCYRIKEFAMTTSTISQDLVDMLKESYDTDIISLHYDQEECVFLYTDSMNKIRPITSLGSGHQSIINIMIGTRY